MIIAPGRNISSFLLHIYLAQVHVLIPINKEISAKITRVKPYLPNNQ